jgi:hypothetical protein
VQKISLNFQRKLGHIAFHFSQCYSTTSNNVYVLQACGVRSYVWTILQSDNYKETDDPRSYNVACDFWQHQLWQKHLCFKETVFNFDVHESVHRDTIMKVTNKMQLYMLIYFSCQLYMFRAMFSPIIKSTWLYLQYLVIFT